MTSPSRDKRLALVLSGGGARGAYEAGIIHYIRTQLPPHISRKRPFDILCGSSVGALNTCFMAATNHNLDYQGVKAFELWDSLTQENVYKRGMVPLTKLMGRTFGGIFRGFLKKEVKEVVSTGKPALTSFKGLVDTGPLEVFLRQIIPWKQIALNIQNGSLQAVSVTTTNVHTGKVELFIDKHPSVNYTGRHMAHFMNIEAQHALASAAIPIFFPCVRIARNYYCDGGLRLNTPLSPAIQLGADKVLVIGLHHESERAQQKINESLPDYDVSPTLGEIIGQVLKSIFLDQLEYDLVQLKRLNLLIAAGERTYGQDFVTKMNAALGESSIYADITARGIRKIDVMSIFPSQDVKQIFRECVQQSGSLDRMLSTFEKLLLRVLDVDLNQGADFLTFILFLPQYLRKLLELGFEDARSHHDQLVAFFEE